MNNEQNEDPNLGNSSLIKDSATVVIPVKEKDEITYTLIESGIVAVMGYDSAENIIKIRFDREVEEDLEGNIIWKRYSVIVNTTETIGEVVSVPFQVDNLEVSDLPVYVTTVIRGQESGRAKLSETQSSIIRDLFKQKYKD
ncbi:MAG: hypothetical protein U0451_02550 [Candidatus Saccharimonadales bacterium]